MTAGVSAEARAAASAALHAERRISRERRQAREKPNPLSGFRSELDYELLLMFAKNELSAAMTTPLLAVIVAVGAMFWAPPAQLLLWLATVFFAKGLLISRHALTEAEAYARLRKTAMDKGLKLADVAQRLIDVSDLLG